MNTLCGTLLIGVGATALTDLWSIVRKSLLGLPAPDYGLVGRWIGHMPRGRFRHPAIAGAAPVRGERMLGWTTHYLIGIAYAALLVAVAGRNWLQQPTLAPAMLVGIGTVVAPFLLMQPAMGAGIAARRTPHPAKARFHSLLMHALFGLGRRGHRLYTRCQDCEWQNIYT
jgi:hypothetical protein